MKEYNERSTEVGLAIVELLHRIESSTRALTVCVMRNSIVCMDIAA